MEIDTFASAANGGTQSPSDAANGWITDADVILSKAKNLFRQISDKINRCFAALNMTKWLLCKYHI